MNDNICHANGLVTVIDREGSTLETALETYRHNPIGTFIPATPSSKLNSDDR